jgi:hypothetical protein
MARSAKVSSRDISLMISGAIESFFIRFAAVNSQGENSTKVSRSVAKSILCMLLIVFSLCQSIAATHSHQGASHRKVKSKETKVFTIKSGVMPSSTKLEVINQLLPWMEEIHFKPVRDERPVPAFKLVACRFYTDLFRVIAPTNAP